MTVADFFTSSMPSNNSVGKAIAGEAGRTKAGAATDNSAQGEAFAAILEKVNQTETLTTPAIPEVAIVATAGTPANIQQPVTHDIPVMPEAAPQIEPGAMAQAGHQASANAVFQVANQSVVIDDIIEGDGEIMAPGLVIAQQMVSSDQAQLKIAENIEKLNIIVPEAEALITDTVSPTIIDTNPASDQAIPVQPLVANNEPSANAATTGQAIASAPSANASAEQEIGKPATPIANPANIPAPAANNASQPATVITPDATSGLKDFMAALPVDLSAPDKAAAVQTWVAQNTAVANAGAIVEKPNVATAPSTPATDPAIATNQSGAAMAAQNSVNKQNGPIQHNTQSGQADLEALATGIQKAETKVATINTEHALAAQKLPDANNPQASSQQAAVAGAVQQSTTNTANTQSNKPSVNRAALASANGQSGSGPAAQSSALTGLNKSPAFEAGTLPFMGAESRPAPQAPGFIPAGLQNWFDSAALADFESLDPTVFSANQGVAHNSAQTMQSAKMLTPQQAAMARQLADQVGVSINKAVADGASEFTIRLNPAEMGNVTVKLKFGENGLLRATVMADSRETLELLQRDSRGLERTLGENSKGAPTIDFSLDDRGGESAGKAFAEALHEDNMKEKMALKDGSEQGDFARDNNPSDRIEEEISLEAVLASVTAETGIDVNV